MYNMTCRCTVKVVFTVLEERSQSYVFVISRDSNPCRRG
jgi:hypothetical protein